MCINKFLVGATIFLLTGCALSKEGASPSPQGTRDFCVETMCNSLENSGEHYQQSQQGRVVDCTRSTHF